MSTLFVALQRTSIEDRGSAEFTPCLLRRHSSDLICTSLRWHLRLLKLYHLRLPHEHHVAMSAVDTWVQCHVQDRVTHVTIALREVQQSIAYNARRVANHLCHATVFLEIASADHCLQLDLGNHAGRCDVDVNTRRLPLELDIYFASSRHVCVHDRSVLKTLQHVHQEWVEPAPPYDINNRNCQHFADALATLLCGEALCTRLVLQPDSLLARGARAAVTTFGQLAEQTTTTTTNILRIGSNELSRAVTTTEGPIKWGIGHVASKQTAAQVSKFNLGAGILLAGGMTAWDGVKWCRGHISGAQATRNLVKNTACTLTSPAGVWTGMSAGACAAPFLGPAAPFAPLVGAFLGSLTTTTLTTKVVKYGLGS